MCLLMYQCLVQASEYYTQPFTAEEESKPEPKPKKQEPDEEEGSRLEGSAEGSISFA